MINISICLTDIPKDKITKSDKNGKQYLSIIVDERKEPDTYGNTHTAYVSQSKEEREKGVKRVYVGNGKEYKFNKQSSAPQGNSTPTSGSDDLPF
jgi:hypothetical protein